MMGHALLDKDGWIQAIVTGDNFDPKHYPSFAGHLELEDEEIQRIKYIHTSLLWDGKKLRQIKDKKMLWDRLRGVGLSSQICLDAFQRHTDLSEYEDVPIGTTVFVEYVNKMFDFPETEIKPGLEVSLSQEIDLDLWESQMVASGLYTPDEAFKSAAFWLGDPSTWPVKVSWKGKPLQIEMFHLGGGNSIHGGFAAHIDRTRPGWFWKQMSLPTLKALYSHGFENITSSVRLDKPDYVNFLTETYGHEVLRQTDKTINLRLNIREAIKNIGEWPARRTLGTDWKWEKGGVLLIEATEDDLPELYSLMDSSWGSDPRKETTKTRLDDMWNLDSASIILAIKDGQIFNARVYRERNDPALSLVLFPVKGGIKTRSTQVEKFTDNQVVLEGVDVWQKAVGYKISSFFIETELHSPQSALWESMGWKVIRLKDGLTECHKEL
jgi:hypothetical protein